jgi:hypothetical protein
MQGSEKEKKEFEKAMRGLKIEIERKLYELGKLDILLRRRLALFLFGKQTQAVRMCEPLVDDVAGWRKVLGDSEVRRACGGY